MGFCRQHLPGQQKSPPGEGQLTDRMQSLAGVIMIGLATNAIYDLAKLALEHLQVFHGDGDPDENRAKRYLAEEFGQIYPKLPSSYKVGSSANWVELRGIYDQAQRLSVSSGESPIEDIRRLEERFDAWFCSLRPTHQEALLAAVKSELAHRKGQ